MLPDQRKLLFSVYKLFDVCIFTVTLFVASCSNIFQKEHATLSSFLSIRVKILNIAVVLTMMLAWYLVFNAFGLYRSRRLEGENDEWKDIIKATSTGTAGVIVFKFIFDIEAFTQLFVLFFWLSNTIITVLLRYALRQLLRKVRIHGRNLRFAIMIGTNFRAYEFAKNIEDRKEKGYKVIGYVDSEIYAHREGLNFLGTVENFSSVLRDHIVDEVFIALPIKSYYNEIQEIIQKSQEQGVLVRHISPIFNNMHVKRLTTEKVGDFAVLTVNFNSVHGNYYFLKRVFDIFVASFLILALSPLFIVAIVSILLTSKGPVFFVQDRVGYNKRIFRLYKFRTMVNNAERLQSELKSLNEMSGPVFKIKDDPRITKTGRWLRKTSIDELPQLLNVVKGDMSLVGPRPLPISDYKGIENDWQRRRLSVLPGITCTWQVSGRNKISFEDWMNLDLEYIDNWKLLYDFKILLKTIPAVLKGEGAS